MRFVFEVKDANKIMTKEDVNTLRKFMLCQETTINTAFPRTRVHLIED